MPQYAIARQSERLNCFIEAIIIDDGIVKRQQKKSALPYFPPFAFQK